jgi:PAS domain S-box-containing protein
MELTEAFLSAIARSIPADFAIYQFQNGQITPLYAARELPAISGMTEDEYFAVAGADAFKIVLESDRPLVMAKVEAMLRRDENADFTYRILHKTKGSVWIHAKSRPLGTRNGCPVFLTVFLNTDGETEDHAFLLSHTASIVYVIDRKTHELLYANEPALAAWGKHAYSGQVCYNFICAQDTPCTWCPVLQMKNGTYHSEFFHNPKQDQWFNLTCRAMNWYGRNAAAIYAVDVTAERRNQLSAEINRESLELLVENTPIGIGVCVFTGGRVIPLAINDRFGELFGMEIDENCQNHLEWLDRVHPDDRNRLNREMNRLRKPDMHIRFAFRYCRERNGAYVWLQLEAQTVFQNDALLVFTCLSDVTAEKESETERELNRRMYETAAREADLIVWQYDIAGHSIAMAEDSANQRLGWRGKIENAPESLIDSMEEKSREPFLKMHALIQNGAPRASCEVWYRAESDGKPRCDRISYTTFFDETGRPTSALGISQNITARKIEEEKYSRFYKQLTEANPDTLGSFRMNLTKNWCGDGQSPQPLYLNLQNSGTVDGFFSAMAERIREGSVRDSFRRFFTCANLLRVFRGGTTQVIREFPFVPSERGVKWGRGSINMVQNPATGDVEAVAYTQDITERKKEELIAQRLTNEIIDYIGLIDLEKSTFEFRNVNRAIQGLPIRRKMDYTVCVGYDIKTYVIPEDRNQFQQNTALEHLMRQLADVSSYSFSYGHTEGGAKLRKQLQYAYLDDLRKEILVIQSDITDTYRQEQEQLRRTRDALRLAEQANHAKTEFLSRISHDIRTPISIISSMTDFAREDLAEPATLQDDLSKIKTANKFLLSLINDVLDISKIDSGKITLNPEPYPFAEYIENIRNMFEPLCAQKGIRFLISGQRNSGVIVADKIRLNQIVLNILSNAVKYTPEGGTVAYQSQSEDLPDGTVRYSFEISDTGIGMSEAFQKIMFEPFMQEYDHPDRPKAQNGTGLGLSIVKRMVDLMGGTISVQSALGKGTTVRCTIRFPDARFHPQYRKPVEPEEPVRCRGTLTGKVLLAEDNEINADIARRILTGFGLRVDHAENGMQAVTLFEASAPGEYQAILMDIQMPALNGYEATRIIRAADRSDAKTIPILAMTADAFSDAMERGYAVGMNAYLTKPVEPAQLLKILTGVISAGESGQNCDLP